jgi:phage terminase small subunit
VAIGHRLWLLIKKKGVRDMLTAKQEAFVQNIIQGMSQADAYRSAYDTQRMSDNAIYREASLLMSNPKIAQRLADISAKADKPKIMSAQKRLEWLTDRIEDETVDINAKLKAIDIMNKMSGEYVTKVEGNLNIAKLEDLI